MIQISPHNIEKLIAYRDFPNTSKVFLDYLYNHKNVSDFYPYLSDEIPSLEQIANTIPNIQIPQSTRDVLVEVLLTQNNKWNASLEVKGNIQRLSNPKSTVIIGGQQAGLFGGPLLCIAKALTVIKLAENLSTMTGNPVIPIFWIASEDHDFEEVNHTSVLTKTRELAHICYKEIQKIKPSVGSIQLANSIEETINELKEVLPKTEFTDDVFDLLANCYQPGKNWCDAFACWMTKLFSKFGLILVDPHDIQFKSLAHPIFTEAITNAPKLITAVANHTNSIISAGYEAQVKVDPSQALFFLETENNRTPLVLDGIKFKEKNSLNSYTAQDLLKILEFEPLRITPSALLRPVIQDVIFPVAAHVVGQAELAYLAQSQAIYNYLKVTAPIRWIRSEITLVENRYSKTLEKFDISLIQMATQKEALIQFVISKISGKEISQIFHETETLFDIQLNKLQKLLEKEDLTLVPALENSHKKIIYQLHNLYTRFINSETKKQEAITQQINHILTALYPKHKKQERVINFISFLARYGFSLIDFLYTNVELSQTYHQTIVI